MKIFLDDIRFPKTEDKFLVIRNFNDFLYTWEIFKHEITEISFDHDLGPDSKTGYDAICLVEKDFHMGNVNHYIKLKCHSANPPGRLMINMTIYQLSKFCIDNSLQSL